MPLVDCRSQVDQCGRCGACLEVCPVYAELRAEPYGARGKVFLLGAVLDGKIELTPRVEELIRAAREEVVSGKGLPLLKKNIFHHLINSQGRLKAMAWLLYLSQGSGLQGLLRRSRLLNLLPGKIGAKESLLPALSASTFTRLVPRQVIPPDPRRKVIYFAGCLTRYLYPQIGQAVAKVLYYNNIESYIPDLPCCGVPALTAGDRAGFTKLATQNIAVLNSLTADIILTDCASCGATLRKYGELLGTPAAQDMSAKVRDISEFLAGAGLATQDLHSLPMRVTYHDPCHLKRGQGVADQPRTLLGAVPDLELVEMAGADRCCGAAGSFSLAHQSTIRHNSRS